MHGSGASLRNTSKHVINETIALCSERQENGTATTSKQAFNDFVLCGVTNNLPHPVKISLPLLCERDEQEVSAGHQQQTDNRSNRQRKTSKLRITKHLVGKQRGKHCNRRQTTHCSRLTNLSAKRQQQPTLKPEPFNIMNARFCTGRWRDVKKTTTGGMNATIRPNSEINSMLESCGFVANE